MYIVQPFLQMRERGIQVFLLMNTGMLLATASKFTMLLRMILAMPTPEQTSIRSIACPISDGNVIKLTELAYKEKHLLHNRNMEKRIFEPYY